MYMYCSPDVIVFNPSQVSYIDAVGIEHSGRRGLYLYSRSHMTCTWSALDTPQTILTLMILLMRSLTCQCQRMRVTRKWSFLVCLSVCLSVCQLSVCLSVSCLSICTVQMWYVCGDFDWSILFNLASFSKPQRVCVLCVGVSHPTTPFFAIVSGQLTRLIVHCTGGQLLFISWLNN